MPHLLCVAVLCGQCDTDFAPSSFDSGICKNCTNSQTAIKNMMVPIALVVSIALGSLACICLIGCFCRFMPSAKKVPDEDEGIVIEVGGITYAETEEGGASPQEKHHGQKHKLADGSQHSPSDIKSSMWAAKAEAVSTFRSGMSKVTTLTSGLTGPIKIFVGWAQITSMLNTQLQYVPWPARYHGSGWWAMSHTDHSKYSGLGWLPRHLGGRA